MLWIVGMNLDVLSGWTVWGGNDPDRFLTVEDRLVLAPGVETLISNLPGSGRHSFHGDARYLKFREEVNSAYSPGATDGDESGLYDFSATLEAIREREVLHAPHSGMAADCLGAALDLGLQFGADSAGYQLARHGPLDRLYRATWKEIDESELDYLECEAALVRLIGWMERLAR
ncbi:hypothetical protein OG799_20580 [Micromonospora sp. NBC_00898]|uniref:hypothetical protein n=1 Tax=Micromonospora sp. NBC_00898 TaxID=2975981 RepID=UPI0038694225|nr:hypothetical protein OG799_20580 [Micromonospora sp. NBC_00898]